MIDGPSSFRDYALDRKGGKEITAHVSLLHGFSSQLLVLLTFDSVSGFLPPTGNQRKHAQYCPSILCALHSAEGEECLACAAHSLETSLMFLDKRRAGVYLVQCMVQCLEQCIVSLKEVCVFWSYCFSPFWCMFYG